MRVALTFNFNHFQMPKQLLGSRLPLALTDKTLRASFKEFTSHSSSESDSKFDISLIVNQNEKCWQLACVLRKCVHLFIIYSFSSFSFQNIRHYACRYAASICLDLDLNVKSNSTNIHSWF